MNPHNFPIPLQQAIVKTVVYADLFDYPLTLVEIHQRLIEYAVESEQLRGHISTLVENGILVNVKGDYYCLKGREFIIEERQKRYKISRKLFQSHKKILYFFCQLPFVKMIAFSGAIAFANCKTSGDLDLFVIVDSRRIWTMYFFMVVFTKLLGKRDIICLNYLFGKKDYIVSQQDFYTAQQISGLYPLSGYAYYKEFAKANKWVKDFLPHWNNGFSEKQIFSYKLDKTSRTKNIFQKLLELKIFDFIEMIIYTIYGSHLLKRSKLFPNHAMVVKKDIIKLHLNDYNKFLMERLENRLQHVFQTID